MSTTDLSNIAETRSSLITSSLFGYICLFNSLLIKMYSRLQVKRSVSHIEVAIYNYLVYEKEVSLLSSGNILVKVRAPLINLVNVQF